MFDQNEYSKINELVFNTAAVGICVTDKNRNFVKVNLAYCSLYGYTEQELIGQPFTIVLPDEQQAHASKLHDDYIDKLTEESAGEWRVKHKAGHLIDVWVTTGRFTDSKNNTYKVTTVTDITLQKRYISQLKKALDEKDVLLKEVHHRVKNNLNMITSLIYLQSDGGSGLVKEKLREISNRIKSISIVHEKLYHHESISQLNAKVFLNNLIDELVKSFVNQNNFSVKLNFEEIVIDENLAIHLGLIVNELVTNSVKHAFNKGNQNNLIVIGLSNNDGYLELTVKDNGVGIKNINVIKESLGFTLITNLAGSENVIITNDAGLKTIIKIKKGQ